MEFNNKAPFVLISGPCQLESREHALVSYGFLKALTDTLNIPFVYKTSFDKANRSSLDGKRGMGFWSSIPVFEELHFAGAKIITDVHERNQIATIAKYVDIIQIPAFLCRQTDLLVAAGESGKTVNVKKGQFLSPHDMRGVIEKIESTGNKDILLTERGTTFGYGDLVVDMRSLQIMKDMYKPVIFDASHSVQKPGGLGRASGGDARFIPALARAAVAVGVAGIFVECHENPAKAPSDGPNMLSFSQMKPFLETLKEIDQVIKG